MSADARDGVAAQDLQASGCAFCERDADGIAAGQREPTCSRCAAVLAEAEPDDCAPLPDQEGADDGV